MSPRWGFKTRQYRFWKIDLLKFQVVSDTSGVVNLLVIYNNLTESNTI